ncbi:MAG: hypothetical protein HC876_21745 [Chloroflexaceae bacterium]|nr:hypothetical protein [Chloroflexaceae bacterium]
MRSTHCHRRKALAELLTVVPVVTLDRRLSQRIADIGTRLLAAVPCYRLHFLPDDSYWQAIDAYENGA